MTDRIDDALTTFYADIVQQPLSTALQDLTMGQCKQRAARRLLATLATGTLVMALAVAGAIVVLAAHLNQIAPAATSPHNAIPPAPAAHASPTPRAPSTMVTFSGAISGTLTVTHTVCSSEPPASGTAGPHPAFDNHSADIEADGVLDGRSYTMIITHYDQEPGADPTTIVGFGKPVSKLGGYSYEGPPTGTGVITFDPGQIATFNIVLTPDQGHGASLRAVGQIACP